MTTSPSGPIEEVEITVLTRELRRILAKGLPADVAAAGDVLTNLRSVYARSVVPNDRLSRVSALNELLPRVIASIADAAYREAEQVLFGLAPGTRGSSLTARRRQAASLRNYGVDHFRDVIEEQMLEAVAINLHNDLLRYRSRVKRSVGSAEPTGDTPRIGPEHLTHEEELISRIWQHVYGLRAELIAAARLSAAEGYEAQVEDHRQAALREEADLKQMISEFVETYGDALVAHGEAEFSVEAITRLSRWQL